jgi:pantoate--beta-alanine ligase
MGALHDGHLSLVAASRARDDRTVATIFVNPLQFVAGEDFESYPRDIEADLRRLGDAGAHCVFTPSAEEMYPPGADTKVLPGAVAEPLEGQHRPGHFTGVATVVAKLFNLVQPDRAYFGQKDAQQMSVVRALVRDLAFDLELVVCPIVRAEDGLALSSRNAYLSGEERKAATCLSRALRAANDAYAGGERDADALRRALRGVLDAEPLALVDYAEVVDPATFRPPGELAVLAVRIGRARLIDNHQLGTFFGDW